MAKKDEMAPRMALPRSPRWNDNRRLKAQPNADGECLFCGRPVDESKATWVHLTDGKLACRAEGVEVTDEMMIRGDQGFWPVGPECAKKVSAAFRFKREDWDR